MQEFSSVTASSYDAESLAPMLTEKAGEGWSVVSIVSAGTNVVAYLTRGGPVGSSGVESAAAAPADTGSSSDTSESAVVAAVVPAAVIPAADEAESELADDSGAVADTATAISPTLPGESVGDAATDIDEVVTPDPAVAEAAAAAVAAADEPAGWGAAPADSTDDEQSIADLAAQVGADESDDSGFGAVAAGVGAAGAGLTDTATDAAAGSVDDAAGASAGLTDTATDAVGDVADTATADDAAQAAAGATTEAAAGAAESTVPAGWYADPSGRFELRYWDGSAWTEHVSRAGQQYTDPPVA